MLEFNGIDIELERLEATELQVVFARLILGLTCCLMMKRKKMKKKEMTGTMLDGLLAHLE